jgi:hypothetical protein
MSEEGMPEKDDIRGKYYQRMMVSEEDAVRAR